MSLSEAKRTLQWNVVTAALTEAGLDAELLAMVEHARHVDGVVNAFARTLMGGADAKQAKNYVKVEMVGLIPPFDRMYIELVRPGGKTSHELREMLRDRLTQIRALLVEGKVQPSVREGIIRAIDRDLAAEAP